MRPSSREESLTDPMEGCIKFDYEELRKATNSFDTRSLSKGGCKLGEGGFGPVFRGKLIFTEVAIKLLRNAPKVLPQEHC